jgi:hypothetical protein
MTKEEYSTLVDRTIDVAINEIVSRKTMTEQTLTFIDAQTISMKVKNIFSNKIGTVPPQIEAACSLSEAILSPTLAQKTENIKKAVGVSGGVVGLGAIIGGIGMGLGWGAGVVTTVTTFFTGATVAGPIGWVVCGVGIAAISGYFAMQNDEAKNNENYRKSLKSSIKQAIDVLWEDYKDKLSVIDTETSKI